MNSHPVFSDYVHLPRLDDLTFAVTLRAEEEGAAELIAKMLPLSRITPGVPVQRVIRTVEKEEGICQRFECIARREKLEELNSENDELRAQLKEAVDKVTATKNRIALIEKSMSIAEGKNDSMRAEIDEATVRYF